MTTLLYTMAWEAYDGETRRLEIYDLQAEQAVAVPISLTPAVTPFVSEISSDDEAMQTVLTGSAKMTFIGNWQTLSGIDLTSSVRYRAILKDTDDNILWLGFLKADVSDQAYDQTATEITLNLIDDIEALDAFRIDTAGTDKPTMGELLAECFGNIYGWADYIFHFTTEYDFDTSRIMRYRIARQNFVHADDDGTLVGNTCREFVEAFCTTFGFTYHQQGCDIFFDRSFSDVYAEYTIDFGEPYCFAKIGNFVSKDVKSYQDIHSRGTDNIVNVSQGYKSITLEPDVNEIPEMTMNIDTKGGSVQKGGGIWLWKSYKVDKISQHGHWYAIAFKPRMADCNVFQKTGNIWSQVPYSERSILSLLKCEQAGCMIMYDDYWCAAEFDKGSAEKDEDKKKLSYDVRIYISPAIVGEDGWPVDYPPTVLPLLTIESEEHVRLTEGGIEISFNPHFFDKPNSGWDLDDRNGLPMKNGGKKKEREEITGISSDVQIAKHLFECRLSVGDMYWTGFNWINDPGATFEIGINDQSANSTTTVKSNVFYIDMIDAENYVAGINLPSQPGNIVLSGKVKFEIVKAYNDTWTLKAESHDALAAAPIVIEGFGIRLVKPIKDPSSLRDEDILEADNKSKEYVRYGENAVQDDKSVSLKMHTIIDGHTALSNILGEDGEPITDLSAGYRIEDALADRLKVESINPRTFLSIGMTNGDVPELATVQLDGGNYATICTKHTDWRTLQSKLHLIKL